MWDIVQKTQLHILHRKTFFKLGLSLPGVVFFYITTFNFLSLKRIRDSNLTFFYQKREINTFKNFLYKAFLCKISRCQIPITCPILYELPSNCSRMIQSRFCMIIGSRDYSKPNSSASKFIHYFLCGQYLRLIYLLY